MSSQRASRVNRREFIRAGVATSLLSLLPRSGVFAQSSASAERPNVLFLFSDQHNATMTGYAGHPNMVTPALDSLAAGGVRFDRAYCQDGVSCPSRTSMITGQYPRTFGVYNNDLMQAPVLSRFTPLPRAFRQAGYYTFSTGKRHVLVTCDTDWDYTAGTQNIPTEVNRDTFHYVKWIASKGLTAQYKHDWAAEFGGAQGAAPFTCRLSVLPPEATTEAFAAAQTIQFLRSDQAKKQPFLAWSTFYRPHQPYTPQKKYADQVDYSSLKLPETLSQNPDELPPGLKRFRELKNLPWDMGLANEAEYRTYIGYYTALIHEIDDHIQSILDTLKEEGLADNTIIIYAADHGDFVGNHGLVEKGAEWHNFYEDTLRVPLIVHWPAKISSGVNTDLVELVDVYPTLLGLCGVPAPSDYPLAGRDLSETLLRHKPVGRQYVVSENWTQSCLIGDDFKYGQWLNCPAPKDDYRIWGDMLMQRSSDPHEKKNLIHDPAHTETLRQMRASLAAWMDKTDDIGRREFFERKHLPYTKA
jgi:arylsulfatase A-like enzyme